jgi:signal transduction histidine kinase
MATGEPIELAQQIIEAEQTRLGNELHDDVIPYLFAARAAVEALVDQPGASPQLKQAAAWIGQAMEHCRLLLRNQLAPKFDTQSWTQAVAQRVNELFGDTLQLQWQVDDAACHFLPRLQLTLYRIVIEAIRNARQHGHASLVRVIASREDATQTIRVQDDGCGFDPLRIPEGHFGIDIMRHRAMLVGGALEIESAPNSPTSVIFSFPLE